MNVLTKLTTAGAVLVLSGGFAFAECVDMQETASTAETSSEAVKTPPIEKDGSNAPLEPEPRDAAGQQAQDAAGAEDREDLVQKEGGTMPLSSSEEDESGEQIATSQQDIEAQQEGEPTAAAEADEAC